MLDNCLFYLDLLLCLFSVAWNGSIYICSGYYVFGFFAWNHHLIVAMLPQDDMGKRWLVDFKNVRNLKKQKNPTIGYVSVTRAIWHRFLGLNNSAI
jgi:hypothetical protein